MPTSKATKLTAFDNKPEPIERIRRKTGHSARAGSFDMKRNGLLPDMQAIACVAILFCPLSACAAEATTSGEIAEAFDKALANCSQSTGYYPERSDALGPYDIAPNEREFAACAYGHIEAHVAAISPVPDQYMRLIDRHRRLTEDVAAERVTRTQRRAEIAAMLDAIRDVENAAIMQRRNELEKVKDIQEQQQLMRDLDRMHRDAVRAQQTIRIRVR